MNSKEEHMRAYMYLGPGEIELRNVPVPTVEPDQILVKVRCALTDGTDLKTYRRGHPNIKPPAMFGHEFSGDIVSVGNNVRGFEPGMRIVAHNSAPCFHCYYCKRGQHSMCQSLLFNPAGAYAEYATVPGEILRVSTFEIPDGITYSQAAAMEPLACVVHGQDVIDIKPGETVAIIGAGGSIGLMHVQLAVRRGASMVVGVDINEKKLETIKAAGASHVINGSQLDPIDEVMRLTNDIGVDVAIESAGFVEAWDTALHCVRRGGRVLWFGGLKPGSNLDLDTKLVHYSEISLHGVFHATPMSVQRAFDFICQGLVDTNMLVTDTLPLEKLEDALQMMIRGDCIKIAIDPEF
jgi:L-iditol 2-dehydrogenase